MPAELTPAPPALGVQVRVAAQNSTRLELYASAQIDMDLYRTDGSNATSYLKAAAADDGACLVQAEAKTITAYAEFVPRGDTFYTDAWAPAVPPADIAVLPG